MHPEPISTQKNPLKEQENRNFSFYSFAKKQGFPFKQDTHREKMLSPAKCDMDIK